MCVCTRTYKISSYRKNQSSPHYPHTIAADLVSENQGIHKADVRAITSR